MVPAVPGTGNGNNNQSLLYTVFFLRVICFVAPSQTWNNLINQLVLITVFT